jgi:hypothetical protein
MRRMLVVFYAAVLALASVALVARGLVLLAKWLLP